MKRKFSGAKKRIIRIIIIICALGMVVSGYFVYIELSEYRAGNDAYNDLKQFIDPPSTQLYESGRANDTASIETGDNSSDEARAQYDQADASDRADVADAPIDTGSSGAASVTGGAPDAWPTVDFSGLRGINNDVVAWLRCPGTIIDYPVVYGEDNEYYLDHLVNGTQNKAGSLFIDCRNMPDFSDRNTIIYGHNMRNGSMFRTITQFGNRNFFNAHPSMYLVTDGGDCYYIELFSAFTASVDEEAWTVNFIDDEAFEIWLEWVKQKSNVASNVQVIAGERVVTFSTCSYSFDNARFVAVGKLTTLSG